MGSGTVALVFLLSVAAASVCFAVNVTYDGRALVVDGKRRVLVSGSIHYPRSTPEMWPDLIKKSKDGGLDIIETYVFWNLHEPNRGQFDFTGRKDLVKFIKLVGEAGLFVHLRIGPYVCAEWNYGGFPLWLHFLPGIQLRTDNEPYKIENEYGNVESEYGSSAKPYIDWAAQMATSMNTGFHGFSSFGDPVPYRPAEDVAFAAARFYQKNGTLLNYYMYHGGTNFGRTSGGPFFTTSYDYDAPLDEFGLLRQPKWGHLKDLHKAIKLCEEAMVATVGNTTSLGQNSEATVYQTESGQCAAFLANWDGQLDSNVYFNGNYYDLPAWSVSILPDCKNVVYNTAKVNSITAIPKFVPQPSQTGPNSSVASFSSWSWFKEPVGISINRDAFVLPGLVEQINTTADKSDFMWYSLSVNLNDSDPLLRDGSQIQLHVESLGHVLYAFVNGRLAGSGKGKGISVDIPVNLEPGNNTIDLLSLTMGLQNYGAFFDLAGAGITGPVQFKGLNNGSTVDLSSEQWTYQVGLKGERVRLPQGISKLWVSQPALPINTPLTWYKTTFSAPPGNSPVAIDFTGMGKGQAWINGQSIGRYWPANISPASGNCVDSCNYRGQYDQKKCLRGCGKPTQQHYHIPRSWLKPTGNILVLLEEIGGNPNNISFATREIGLICARVSESYPAPLDLWSDNYLTRVTKPTLLLECPFPNQVITDLPFISFGNPHGTCGSFTHGRCRSRQARRVVRKACMGKPKCSIEVTVDNLGEPCANVTKSLAVAAYCS
ncbi:hypothetical protein DH2020_024321 [Rehmannia glutinosa]|uniref:beta-galactosidase n=1 Tax=Rehmannia glutinosa TaxID=99300 RepID=A0ABR0W2U0_REHGL